MESTSDGKAAAFRDSVVSLGVHDAFDAVWSALPSTQAVGTISFAISFLASSLMILRTVIYIVRRRQGLAGPANARRLAKFWSLFGALQFVSVNLRAYMEPFGLTWLLRLCQALAFLAAVSGRQSSRCEHVYDEILCPFYDEHALAIEQQLARGRGALKDVDDAARELAKYMLDHVAVGGLSAGARALAKLAKASDDPSPMRKGQPPAAGPVDRTVIASAAGVRDFYAGEAGARADAVSKGTSGFSQVSVAGKRPDLRQAYEGSRSLRAEFCRRHSRREMATSEAGSGPPGDR
jgi:hypothetical protein